MSQKSWNSYRKQIGFLSLPQWPVWMQMPIRLDPYQAWISSPCNIILFSNVYLYCLSFVLLFVYLYCQNYISFTFFILSFLLCCCQHLLSRMKLWWKNFSFPKNFSLWLCWYMPQRARISARWTFSLWLCIFLSLFLFLFVYFSLIVLIYSPACKDIC